ncbi:class I SAM-dependent methyltransferase [Gandjariella thermophila]|uniref:SAM-dependent methyltransferase n=1 Tax=Gandjariella thermophila TaxID=1931992 RepID=A0A4D4JFC9_9PSEU|nr:class I SAM-dependent methyltransferase [Gandjariella thermophila]GDY33029.1 SAM-dependent methyltransferase [Gandjariella thermophila]
MEHTVPQSTFDTAYADGSPPWVTDAPQPAIVALERGGWIRGAVLDAGCGTGEHTIHLAGLGYDVLGVDFAPHAVERARANAAARGIAARFEVADALDLGGAPRFDTVVDSALFHVFGPEDRARYVRSLHAACRPGALVHVLALSNAEPGTGPRISDSVIRDAFAVDGWELDDLRPSRYRAVVFDPEDAAYLRVEVGAHADMLAWLARARRL